jgi:hypothetical protein
MEVISMREPEHITFRDKKLRSELVRLRAEQELATGHAVDLSDLARPIFALGLALIKRNPGLLVRHDGSEE